MKGIGNLNATRAEQFGRKPDGKDALTKKALIWVQRSSLNPQYTSPRQLRYATLMGSAAANLACRVVFVAHVAFVNMKWEVSQIHYTI